MGDEVSEVMGEGPLGSHAPWRRLWLYPERGWFGREEECDLM